MHVHNVCSSYKVHSGSVHSAKLERGPFSQTLCEHKDKDRRLYWVRRSQFLGSASRVKDIGSFLEDRRIKKSITTLESRHQRYLGLYKCMTWLKYEVIEVEQLFIRNVSLWKPKRKFHLFGWNSCGSLIVNSWKFDGNSFGFPRHKTFWVVKR